MDCSRSACWEVQYWCKVFLSYLIFHGYEYTRMTTTPFQSHSNSLGKVCQNVCSSLPEGKIYVAAIYHWSIKSTYNNTWASLQCDPVKRLPCFHLCTFLLTSLSSLSSRPPRIIRVDSAYSLSKTVPIV